MLSKVHFFFSVSLFSEKCEDTDIVKFEWKELYNLAVEHHGSVELVFQHVLNQHDRNGKRLHNNMGQLLFQVPKQTKD